MAYGPSKGKGTGERTLMMSILQRLKAKNFLFMVDAGLYSFPMMLAIEQQDCAFLLKVSSNTVLPVAQRLPDGSYRAPQAGKNSGPIALHRETKKMAERNTYTASDYLSNSRLSPCTSGHQHSRLQHQRPRVGDAVS